MLRNSAIIIAAIVLNAGILGLSVTAIDAINQYLTVSSCKHDAGLSNMDDSHCALRVHENI